jgi:hypothetical protein
MGWSLPFFSARVALASSSPHSLVLVAACYVLDPTLQGRPSTQFTGQVQVSDKYLAYLDLSVDLYFRIRRIMIFIFILPL